MNDKTNNTGVENSGDRNSGDRNSGDRNSGDRNSGYCNSGYCNSGDWNSGYRNSGDRNSGYCNSGYCNSGDWNSGDRNSGDRNSGYWNSGNRNSGMFNTDEPTMRMFNKDTGLKRGDITIPDFMRFELNEWIAESDMTDQEKIDNATFHTCGGYLKTTPYKEAFQKAWNGASEEDRKLVMNLPNFDAEIFKEISGIDVGAESVKELTVEEISKKLGYEVKIVKS